MCEFTYPPFDRRKNKYYHGVRENNIYVPKEETKMNKLQKYLADHVFVNMRRISATEIAEGIVDGTMPVETAYRVLEMNLGYRPFFHYMWGDECDNRTKKVGYLEGEIERIMHSYMGRAIRYRRRHSMNGEGVYYSPEWIPTPGIKENILYLYNYEGTFSDYANVNRVDEVYATANLTDAEREKYEALMHGAERHTLYDDTCGYGGGHHTRRGNDVYAREALDALITIAIDD